MNCSEFKTGKFTYKEKPFEGVIVTRTKKRQTEYDPKSGLKIMFKIRWTSDCHYDLIQLRSNNKEVNKYKGSIISVDITKTYGDKYEYTAEYLGIITKYTIIKVGK
jgi:hypothetical protein